MINSCKVAIAYIFLIVSLNHAYSIDSLQVADKLGRGKFFYAQKNYSEAIKYLKAAEMLDSSNGQIHYYLGEIARRLHDQTSITHFKKAFVFSNYRHIEIVEKIALFYYNNAQFDSVLLWFKKLETYNSLHQLEASVVKEKIKKCWVAINKIDTLDYPLLIERVFYTTTIDTYIDTVAQLLEKYPFMRIEIDCHRQENRKGKSFIESKKQAVYVKQIIKKRGIQEERVKVSYYGEVRTLVSLEDTKANLYNNRIEVYALW